MCLVGPRNSLVAFDVFIHHLPFPHLPLYSSGIDGCENWTSFLCYIETILLLPLFLITIHPHFHSHPSSGGTIQISGNMSILGVLLHRMLDGSGIRCTMHRSCTSRVREIIKLPWESFSYVRTIYRQLEAPAELFLFHLCSTGSGYVLFCRVICGHSVQINTGWTRFHLYNWPLGNNFKTNWWLLVLLSWLVFSFFVCAPTAATINSWAVVCCLSTKWKWSIGEYRFLSNISHLPCVVAASFGGRVPSSW